MAQCKTAVTPLLTHWSYCSLALRHRNGLLHGYRRTVGGICSSWNSLFHITNIQFLIHGLVLFPEDYIRWDMVRQTSAEEMHHITCRRIKGPPQHKVAVLSAYRNSQDKDKTVSRPSGPLFNINMSSYQTRKFHCGDKTVVRSSYLHIGNSYTGKTASSCWISPQTLKWEFLLTVLQNKHML